MTYIGTMDSLKVIGAETDIDELSLNYRQPVSVNFSKKALIHLFFHLWVKEYDILSCLPFLTQNSDRIVGEV